MGKVKIEPEAVSMIEAILADGDDVHIRRNSREITIQRDRKKTEYRTLLNRSASRA